MFQKLIFLLGILSSGILNNDENFIECAIVRKKQYFPCSTTRNACSVSVSLNSACIRCETCLLIANQIGESLSILHKQTFPKNNFDESQVKSAIAFICDNSFENYGLMDINGKRIIYDYLPGANAIYTNVDGQWDQHLKERCHELTEVLGTTKLYETWKLSRDVAIQSRNWTKLETSLCQQENAFLRDCRGMPIAARHNHCVSHKYERFERQINNLIQREKMFS